MSIENWSEHTILVELDGSNSPGVREEMQATMQTVRERGDCDVVMDFSHVARLNSGHLADLLRLHKLLADCSHKLLLCGFNRMTRGILTVANLDDVFDIVADRFDALAVVGCQTYS